MSAPQVVSVQPDVGATDVVLAIPITVTFDQLIDTTTVDSSTFSLTYYIRFKPSALLAFLSDEGTCQ